MVRPIKYRAWDKERKEMHDVYALFLNEDGTVRYVYFWDDTPMEKHRNVELLQFTGLLDKKGVEIYEGDIILFGDNAIHGGTHGKVIWLESRVGFVYEFIDGKFKGQCTDMVDDWRTYEVVGNVFENPELLEATE
ncbi:MAG: YopX protein [Methanobacterium sp. PtaB.Bin024]|nr:MAG: YopX protein [Methanobacterium sp. PtaB.Bin024]